MSNLMTDLAMEASIIPAHYTVDDLESRLPADWSITLGITKDLTIDRRIYDHKEMLKDLKNIRKELESFSRRYSSTIQNYRKWAGSIVDEIEPLTVTVESTEANLNKIRTILLKAKKPPVKCLADVLKSYTYKTSKFSLDIKFKDRTRYDDGNYHGTINPNLSNIPNEVEITISKRELIELVRYRDELIDWILDLEEDGALYGMHSTGWDDPPLRILMDYGSDLEYPDIDAHFLSVHNSTDEITGPLIDLVGVTNLAKMVAPVNASQDNPKASKSWMSRLANIF